MITLLANGCSHTAGAEIEYSWQGECYEKAWPRWLADDMGWNWINLAESSNSNEHIQRTTVDWIIENVEVTKKYKPEELVVMIMWSGVTRFEAWNSQSKKLQSFTGLTINKDTPLELKEYIKYRTIINNIEVNFYKNLMTVYLTAKYLEGLNIKYYFMNGLDAYLYKIEEPSICNQYQMLREAYGDRAQRHLAFFDCNDDFWEYMKRSNIPMSVHAVCDHYGVDGQKFWKDRIKSWMLEIDNNS